jgi:hypothetical protein
MIEPESHIRRVDLVKILGLFLVLSVCLMSFIVPLKRVPPTLADANAALQTWFTKAIEQAPCMRVSRFIKEKQCTSSDCPDVYLRLGYAWEVCSAIPAWFESCLTESAKSCLMSGGDCAVEEAKVLQCFERKQVTAMLEVDATLWPDLGVNESTAKPRRR